MLFDSGQTYSGHAFRVEEFFVRPNLRRRGLGRKLFAQCRELSNTKGLPLNFFVTPADALPSNLKAMRALVAGSGYIMSPSPVPWASAIFQLGSLSTDLAIAGLRSSALRPRPVFH